MFQTGEQISFWAQLTPGNIAFADQDHKITFKELDVFTRKISYSLREKGIERGDLVGISLPPHLSWIFMLSIFRLGAIATWPTSPKPYIPEVMPLWLISINPQDDFPKDRTIIFNDSYLSEINSGQQIAQGGGFRSPDEIAAVFPTSGSTGTPKYIAIKSGELRDIASRPSTYDSFGEDSVLSLMGFGSTWATWAALKCLVLGKPYLNCVPTESALPNFILQYSVRTLIGSPVQISKFLEIQEKTNADFSLVKSVLIGGSAPSAQLIKRVKTQLDCKLYNTYGSTEAGHIAIFEVTEDENPGALIRPPVRLEIVDENGNKVSPNVIGNIRYQNPGMANSYFNNPKASAEFFVDGFFYPGDLGYINDEGRLVLAGRDVEVINLGGVKVNPEVIDKIALSQLGVLDCGTFAALDKSGIENAVIAIVVDGDFKSDHFARVIGEKSPYPVIAATIVESIPRNEAGKILRQLLRENYELKKSRES
jgi:acyl-coenzyme A synthetase/AMP-(fatty) acid ligase